MKIKNMVTTRVKKAKIGLNNVLLIIRVDSEIEEHICSNCILNSNLNIEDQIICNPITRGISINGDSLESNCDYLLGTEAYIVGVIIDDSLFSKYPTDDTIFNEFCKDSCIYYEVSDDSICKNKKGCKCPLKWLF